MPLVPVLGTRPCLAFNLTAPWHDCDPLPPLWPAVVGGTGAPAAPRQSSDRSATPARWRLAPPRVSSGHMAAEPAFPAAAAVV